MSKQAFLTSSFRYRQQDPSFVGQNLDDEYINGPKQQRKCTDVLCCLLFLVLIGGMGYVGFLGFKTGKPQLLASPFDEDGKQCGVDPEYQPYGKIFISLMIQDPTDVGFVCVKQCPLNNSSILQCHTNQKVPSCSSLKIYESQTIVNLCYPSQQILKTFDFQHFVDISTLQKYFSDLKSGWPLLGACVGFAFLVSIFFTVFIRFFAGCFVWLTIILFWIIMIIVGTAAFMINDLQFLKDFINYDNLPSNMKDRDYQIACAVICWTLSFIELMVVCCFTRQIRISIGILKASADFTREQCYAFLIPVYITLMQIAFLAIWLTTLLYVFSSASKVQPFNDTPFGFVQFNRDIQIYSVLYLFGLLWIIFFLQAMGDYWTCSTVAIWYFEEGNPSSPVCRSIGRSFKQVGSLAFGSLIVAIVMFLRIMLEYFTKALKQQTLGLQQQAAPAKFLLKCASCCIACFERVVRFLTKNAYIMMAISGKSFCQSAKQSFYLMLRTTMQFAISHGTTKIFIVFGKLMIVSLCCICGYLLLTTIDKFKTQIYSPVFMTILFGIVSFPVANAFMSLFQMASNTILMCYSLQLDLAKGTNPRCPDGLKNFLRNYISQSEYSQVPQKPKKAKLPQKFRN